MTQLQKSIQINAPRHQVWDHLKALDQVGVWASGITNTKNTATVREGVGAQRSYTLKGAGNITENVVEWNPRDHHFAYTVTGMPLVNYMKTIWRVESVDEKTTKVSLVSNFDGKFGVLGKILEAALLKGQVGKRMGMQLAELKYFIEHGEPAGEQHRDQLELAAVR